MPEQAPRQAEGQIVSIQGAVEDVRFAGAQPPLNEMLRTGRDGEVVIEVAGLLVNPGERLDHGIGRMVCPSH